MIILRIEHAVPDFEEWKKAFDSDPINRKQSGVLSYRIFRRADDAKFVLLDLAFNTTQEAEDCLSKLQKLWNRIQGKIMVGPQTAILELLEEVQL